MDAMTIAEDIVGSAMSPVERLPVLCEIIRKTENLQVRAMAVLIADAEYEKTHGSWTAFCRKEFGWDDSYASRMKKAAQMVLSGVSITNESQARALASVDPEKREEVLEKARKAFGQEPSASQIAAAEREFDDEDEDGDESSHASRMLADQREIDEVIAAMRDVMKKIKALPKSGAGRWINMAHLVADMKNAANTLKHGRPHGPCDEWGTHDDKCLCGGTGWLPQHVLERPKTETDK
jgi:hypothetical protein